MDVPINSSNNKQLTKPFDEKRTDAPLLGVFVAWMPRFGRVIRTRVLFQGDLGFFPPKEIGMTTSRDDRVEFDVLWTAQGVDTDGEVGQVANEGLLAQPGITGSVLDELLEKFGCVRANLVENVRLSHKGRSFGFEGEPALVDAGRSGWRCR